ncbi:MAG TPA: hypothetical protein VLW51_04790 [Solirubrobacteraceae bacterium]|nr:hypothetical protein [Solirubrobacteraceae bacterium]
MRSRTMPVRSLAVLPLGFLDVDADAGGRIALQTPHVRGDPGSS